MTSYKERILEVIGEEKMGLTTVDVAKKAGVSKTTVIKYLSVLSSEGQVEFVEVGPSKLWRKKSTSAIHDEEIAIFPRQQGEPVIDMTFSEGSEERIVFSFRINTDRICELLKCSKKCASHVEDR